MNRKILIIIIIGLICIILFTQSNNIVKFYYHLSTQHPSDNDYPVYQILLDDDKILISDGDGPYKVPDSALVWFTEKKSWANGIIYQMSQPGTIYSDRNIIVRFSDAQWKSMSVMDIPPKQETGNYHINVYFWFEGLEFADIEVGGRENISSMDIDLVDVNNMENYVWSIGRSDNASVPLIYVPPQLYKEGHAELIRDSEDVWILDVDAWFIAHYAHIEDNYIRLSFMMTITFREE